MNRKNVWILTMLVIFALSLLLGFVTYELLWGKTSTSKSQIELAEQEKITDECTEEGVLYPNIEEASSAETKISPNADFIMKKKYKNCGHIITTKAELPTELVNKTQEEIEEEYRDFVIESFGKDEIVFLKEEEGICMEHFVLREKEGKVVVYSIQENGEEKLVEETGITTEYLPQTDVINLKQGIKIYGKEKLNSTLEDFE